MQTQDRFQQMRSTVIFTARNSMEASPFDNAYLFAWHAGVYPIHDSIEDCDQPFANSFTVNARQMDELNTFLQGRYREHDPITFWQLEEIFETHLVEEWDRQKLIDGCRYLCLSEALPESFWQSLLRMATPDSELHVIRQRFIKEEIIFM